MKIDLQPKVTKNNISYTEVQSWRARGLHVGFGDRSLDVRTNYLKWQNFSPKKLLLLKQVHGAEIVDLRGNFDSSDLANSDFLSCALNHPEADAWIADLSMLPLQQCALGIETADCTPVLISVVQSKVVALCHCGWRSAVLDLLPKVLRRLLLNASAQNIEIAIGPAASGRCYEVGDEVATQIEQAWQRTNSSLQSCRAILKHSDAIYADISTLLFQQAVALGIPEENIGKSSHCTISDERYFSYRRDQKNPGRQVSFMELLD